MKRPDRMLGLLWVVVVMASLLLFALALWTGDLNQDEGWYLYAGRLVAEGQHPYIDFASTQGPVMAYVYALSQPLVNWWGVAGGRLFTALLGMLSIVGTAWLASRLVTAGDQPEPRLLAGDAALLAFLLLGLNLYHVYFSTVVKTYALTSCWLVYGFIALTRATGTGKPVAGRLSAVAVSGVLLTVAAATRLSAVAAPALTGAVLLWAVGRRRLPLRILMVFSVAVLVTGLAITLPFVLRAPEAFRFGMLTFHTARETGGALTQLAYKGGFISRLTGFYFLPVLIVVGLVVRRGLLPESGVATRRLPLAAIAVLASATGMTLVHLAAAFPYDDYQVIAMGPAVAGLVALWSRESGAWRVQRAGVVALLVLALAQSFSSPLLHDWMTGERDRIWWPMQSEFPLQRLRRAAARVQALRAEIGDTGDLLLTQDTYLAVEGGLRVPSGLELGPFSCFPGLSTDQAIRLGVMTPAMLESMIATMPTGVAAFSGYGFAIAAPSITELPVDAQARLWAIVDAHYCEVDRIEGFGQAATPLRFFVRRP